MTNPERLSAQMDVDEMREVLSRTVRGLDSGQATPASANAISNAVGKMLGSVKLQMEYARYMGRRSVIPLLEDKKDD